MRKTIIADLDGTLADHTHRLPLLPTKNLDRTESWKEFNSACLWDSPIKSTIDLINALSLNYRVVILTSRCNHVSSRTRRWMQLNGVAYDDIIMRREDDHRPSTEMKKDVVLEIGLDNILCCFDDDPAVIKMFREVGLTVYDVAGHETTEGRVDLQSGVRDVSTSFSDTTSAMPFGGFPSVTSEKPAVEPRLSDAVKLTAAKLDMMKEDFFNGPEIHGKIKASGKTVIILNGPPGVGKDVTASNLTKAGGTVLSFKTPMFDIARAILGGCVYEYFLDLYGNRILKDVPSPRIGGMSPRQLFIWISESVIKPKFGNTFFGERAVDSVANSDDNLIVFSDGGFADEVRVLVEKTGASVRLARLRRGGIGWGEDSRSYIHRSDLGDYGDYAERDFFMDDGDFGKTVEEISRWVTHTR